MLQYDRSLQVRGQFRLSGRPGQVDAESVGDAFAIGRVGGRSAQRELRGNHLYIYVFLRFNHI